MFVKSKDFTLSFLLFQIAGNLTSVQYIIKKEKGRFQWNRSFSIVRQAWRVARKRHMFNCGG
jgi:hypothetical protein